MHLQHGLPMHISYSLASLIGEMMSDGALKLE